MSNESPFPAAEPASLLEEDVIAYLLEWRARGFEVVRETRVSYPCYSVIVSTLGRITLHHDDPVFAKNVWRISNRVDGRRLVATASTPTELRALVEGLAQHEFGITPRSVPQPQPFRRGEPASNIGRLRALIGDSLVEAVFDPYLDNKGIETLLTLHTLGVAYAPSLRLLGSAEKAGRLWTASYTQAFLTEVGASAGAARHQPCKGHENRLLLLGGGDIVAPGCSLNNLNVDERPHRDADKGARAAFEAWWGRATTLA